MRHQKSVKKQKRPTKVIKVISKAMLPKYEKLIIFSCFWDLLVSINWWFQYLELQGQKGQKGCSDSYNYKLAHLDVKSCSSNIHRQLVCNLKGQFGQRSCTQSIQRPKLALKTKKLEKLKKFYRMKWFGFYKYFHLAVMSYAPFLHFFGLQGQYWPLKWLSATSPSKLAFWVV